MSFLKVKYIIGFIIIDAILLNHYLFCTICSNKLPVNNSFIGVKSALGPADIFVEKYK